MQICSYNIGKRFIMQWYRFYHVDTVDCRETETSCFGFNKDYQVNVYQCLKAGYTASHKLIVVVVIVKNATIQRITYRLILLTSVTVLLQYLHSNYFGVQEAFICCCIGSNNRHWRIDFTSIRCCFCSPRRYFRNTVFGHWPHSRRHFSSLNHQKAFKHSRK